MSERFSDDQYEGAAGGWGSLKGIGEVARRERPTLSALETLARQNKVRGHMCTSCAFGKPVDPHAFEFCENGAKATLWELTSDRCGPSFFERHTLTELRTWRDYDLEMTGRLTHPLRYDPETDRYVECSWDDAFNGIARELQLLDPKSAVFYASGKASLETSYLYALFARMYGNNNLPDSSNMCHETTSVALKDVIGSPVGTCVLDDFDHCDAIFCLGQNPGTNSPRFLHQLQQAVKRGCKVIVFNPVREQGLVRFINPQSPVQMLTGRATELAHQYLQVKPGGDIAALTGMCKHIIEVDDACIRTSKPSVLDRHFIETHTKGLSEFAYKVRTTSWAEIEREAGLTRTDLKAAADVYLQAKRVIGVYGMGLTQHVHGSQSVQMFMNLLLLRGNIGREGAGMSPMRGHSNVQGQRTVGVSEKPDLVPLDTLAKQFDFEPPRDIGLNTVTACEGVLDGSVRAFVGLGGNFVRAIPDRDLMEPAWRSLALTVSVAIKLNRTHLIPGRASYLLPCLARSELDIQACGPQAVSMEDTFSHIHGSFGKRAPVSEHLRSELAIVAGIAKAVLPPHPKWEWDTWTADYGLVRDLISDTYREEFYDFNARLFIPGGFYRGNSARDRHWKTDSGKAQFTVPTTLTALGIGNAPGRFHLITMRSNDQFNTTIYGFNDRLRGLKGSRSVLLINRNDMARACVKEGEIVSLVGDADDGAHREVSGLTITPFNLPDGCLGGYYPEMNALIPLWYHDEKSGTPASKSVPVKIVRSSAV